MLRPLCPTKRPHSYDDVIRHAHWHAAGDDEDAEYDEAGALKKRTRVLGEDAEEEEEGTEEEEGDNKNGREGATKRGVEQADDLRSATLVATHPEKETTGQCSQASRQAPRQKARTLEDEGHQQAGRRSRAL